MIKTKQIQIPCAGYSIAADWYEGTNDEVLLVLPGYTSTKANYSGLVQAIVEKTDVSALVIDYSGHGESPFELDDLTPAQNFLEVITAFDWTVENHPEKKITVMGTSYGGLHTAQLTKYREFYKIIFRVPAIYPPNSFYTKWKDVGADHYLEYRTNADLSAHPLLARAKSFKGQTLVITHELDTMCPPNNTDAFIDAFTADHWEALGFKHGLDKSDVTEEQINEYIKKITDWINK